MRDGRYLDGMVNTREAARILGIRPRTLELWRSQSKGPTYAKIGRAVRYGKGALQKYIEDNECLSPTDMAELFRTFNSIKR